MSNLNGRFLGNNTVNETKIRLQNNSSLKARNAADSADVNILKLDGSNIVQLQTQTQIAFTPTSANDLTSKSYVDTTILTQAASWPTAVLDGPLNTPPSPVIGDRYLVGTSPTGVWVGHANEIAQYNSGGWVFFIPIAGTILNVNTYTLGVYYFNGSVWTTKNFAIVDNVTLKVNGSNQLEGLKPTVQVFTLTGTDISNGYVNLTYLAANSAVLLFVNGLLQRSGTDYTLSTVGGVTRVTFAGDIIAAGTALISGDNLTASYSYL